MAGGGGPLLLLLPDLVARSRDGRVRADARHRRDEPGQRVHRTGCLAPGALAQLRLLAHRSPPRFRHRDRRVDRLAVRPSGGLRGGRAGRHRLSIDVRIARPPGRRAVLLPGRRRPARDQMSRLELLAGPELSSGAERLASHVSRVGPLPRGGRSLIELLVRTELTGRGGAGFPVGVKWRAVAAASGGSAVVIVNGAEGEPHSKKDRLLMSSRPHLVLDGALLAAASVNAKE